MRRRQRVHPYRLFCVTLSTPNIDRTVAWYRDKLGYQVQTRREFPQAGTRVAVLEAGDLRLELLEHKDRSTHEAPAGEADRPNRSHVALLVDDLDAKMAELRRKDVRPVWSKGVDHELGLCFQFIKDCDGNLIQLIELLDPLPPRRRPAPDA
jgi:methylmalonyl-CoA/ethylmalonyl-CoA epimerase